MKKIFITTLFLLLLAPTVSLAASLSLTGDKDNFTENEEFLVEVFLDTEDASVNAVEGVLKFSTELLTLKEIRDGNSLINFWVEKPNTNTEGQVSFSGIITSGISGSDRFLFGMVMETKKIGQGTVSLSGVQVLQNDGLGTKISTKTNPFKFLISKEGSGTKVNLKIEDTVPPESFTPYVANDPSIYDGQYFVVFSTVDKGVGVDHFEIREGFWGDYVRSESPYLLTDQSLSKNIYVVAFDKNGNERKVVIDAQNLNLLFQFGIIIGIILIICIWYYRKKLRKFLK